LRHAIDHQDQPVPQSLVKRAARCEIPLFEMAIQDNLEADVDEDGSGALVCISNGPLGRDPEHQAVVIAGGSFRCRKRAIRGL
jgi:hypothetical protein